MAVLTTIALIIFIIEAQIPMPIPVPGVKLGLANAVTLFALFYNRRCSSEIAGQARNDGGAVLPTVTADSDPQSHSMASIQEIPSKARDDREHVDSSYVLQPSLTIINVFAILLCRIILGAIFTGRPIVVVYSLVGGVLAFVAQVLMKRFVSPKQIWVCGAVGAIFHNVGQIATAMVITGTPAIIMYLPILIIAGIFTGVLTGFIAQLTLSRLDNVALNR